MNRKANNEHISKTKFGSKEYVAMFACIIVGLVMMIVMISSGGNENENATSSTEDHTVVDLQSKAEESSASVESDVNSEDGMIFDIVKVDSDGMYKGDLVLVNNLHLYKFKDETELVEVYEYKNGKYKQGSGEEVLFEKTVVAANEFLGDFYDLTCLKNVTMVTGFLTEAEQQTKYEKYIKTATAEDAQKWGVKPGASDHHTALSFNLVLYPSGGKIGEGDYAWITENAHRYGFIVRYPETKSEITSVRDSNHFRYVGIPHAEYMKNNDLVLEEYISALEKTSHNDPLKITSGNKEYLVYYYPADLSSSETEIKVPSGYEYTVSGDNVSGFIITAYAAH